MQKLLLLFFFGLISCSNSQGQDSTTMFEQNATLFSNRYIFYSDGTFRHYFETDDAQTWYGQGTYCDKGKKRILRFGDPDLTTKVEFEKIHCESNFERTVKISGGRFLSQDYYGTTRKRIVVFAEKVKQ